MFWTLPGWAFFFTFAVSGEGVWELPRFFTLGFEVGMYLCREVDDDMLLELLVLVDVLLPITLVIVDDCAARGDADDEEIDSVDCVWHDEIIIYEKKLSY